MIALLLGIPLVETFLQTALAPRCPTAILATGLVVLASMSPTYGLVRNSVAGGRLEQNRFAYLAQTCDRTMQ